MKKSWRAVWAGVAMLSLQGSPVGAQTGKLGLGLVLGEPIGISGKYWLSDKAAIDGAIGGRYGHHDYYYCDENYYRRHGYDEPGCHDESFRLQIHSDFLWHVYLPANLPGRLPLYLGLGGRLITPNTEFGLRFPLGISYLFDNLPIDIFAEIVPVFVVAPYADGDVDGGVGVRYYFDGPPSTGSGHRRRGKY